MSANDSWNRGKYAKAKGRSQKGPGFVQLFHYFIDTPQFYKLKGNALKLLVYLVRQYDGKNNGDLSVSTEYMKKHWRSQDTKDRALGELLKGGWIIETRKGGMGMGASLFAITWKPIDACDGKHSMEPTTYPLNLWKQDEKKTSPEIGPAPVRQSDRAEAA
jgi:hypothetical protein